MRLIKNPEPESKISDIEEMAAALLELWNGHLMKIVDDNGSSAGLCLLSDRFDIEKKKNLEEKIASCSGLKIEKFLTDEKDEQNVAANLSIINKTQLSPGRDLDFLLPGYDQFEKDLAASFVQAKRTRLPFSLILMQPDFTELALNSNRSEILNSIDFLVKKINETLDPGDVLCQFGSQSSGISVSDDSYKFAVIMHSAGLNRARETAEEFRKTIKREALGEEDCLFETLSLGIGVVVAGKKLAPFDFIKSVEKKLIKAASRGDLVSWEQKKSQDHSCQVTAEERTLLFRCLN